jgi:hypothetical protein
MELVMNKTHKIICRVDHSIWISQVLVQNASGVLCISLTVNNIPHTIHSPSVVTMFKEMFSSIFAFVFTLTFNMIKCLNWCQVLFGLVRNLLHGTIATWRVGVSVSNSSLCVWFIVTKFLGRWGRGTGSWYVVRYLRDTFTLRVKNEPVNPGRGRRTWVEGGEPVLCDYGLIWQFFLGRAKYTTWESDLGAWVTV